MIIRVILTCRRCNNKNSSKYLILQDCSKQEPGRHHELLLKAWINQPGSPDAEKIHKNLRNIDTTQELQTVKT